MEKDLDALLWCLKKLGMCRDSQLHSFDGSLTDKKNSEISKAFQSTKHSTEEFLFIVVLIYFTEGLYTLDEA